MLADVMDWLAANLFAAGADKNLQSRVVDALRKVRPQFWQQPACLRQV